MKITKIEKKRLMLAIQELKSMRDTYVPTLITIMKRNGLSPTDKIDMARCLLMLIKELEDMKS